jgi:hypothetical protein
MSCVATFQSGRGLPQSRTLRAVSNVRKYFFEKCNIFKVVIEFVHWLRRLVVVS